LFGLNNVAIASAESILRRIFLIFPGFCLGRGVLDIALNDYSNQYYEFIGQSYCFISIVHLFSISGRDCEWSSVGSPFNWESLYLDITVMGIVGISAFILTIFCDCILHVDSNTVRERLLIEDVDEDSDVSAERSRVLCVIGEKAKFGYFGGKIISRDVLKHIGYCPQFDALYEELTAREHLIYYARIHGFESQSVKKNIGLEEYADIEASAYSGGTKRKLSTAIALVGNPQIIFLDEPTTGMDPRAPVLAETTIELRFFQTRSLLGGK
uniref:ABC transporter domain-containing protein n=1 Tax=Parascaris equorum TaxID=6256 RepID=A0A914RHK7_PAREQ